jgi:RNA polymerase sigma-70 factor, ECF subfamily
MATPPANAVTQLLRDWRKGDQAALAQLMPVVYQELRKIARSYMKGERRDRLMDPTDLIHEVYLRLVSQNLPEWQNRAHFYGVASQIMRQILVEHARALATAKRGGGGERISLDDATIFSKERAADLVALDDALTALASVDARKCRIIELRFFGGMSVEETAEVLGISVATVGREARLAQAWLHRELSGLPAIPSNDT